MIIIVIFVEDPIERVFDKKFKEANALHLHQLLWILANPWIRQKNSAIQLSSFS